MVIEYISKPDALKNLKENDTKIICNDNIKQYFFCESYQHFLNLIKTKKEPTFYEYINPDKPLKLFFDIEIHKSVSNTEDYFYNPLPILDQIHETLIGHYPNWIFKKIVLTSHDHLKKSFHVIYNITNEFNQTVYFENYTFLKKLYRELKFDLVQDTNDKKKLYNIIDPSVYRDGVFRTIYSTKLDKYRPLIKDDNLTTFDGDFELGSFVCHCPISENTIIMKNEKTTVGTRAERIQGTESNDTLSKQDIKIILKYISKNYTKTRENIREIYIKKDQNCIIVALKDLYCHFIEEEHSSNHQYIVIDTISSKVKCHDELCKTEKYCEIKIEKYPLELSKIITKYLVINQDKEIELIKKTSEECTDFIRNFDTDVNTVVFNKDDSTFSAPITLENKINFIGKCPRCKVQHQINIDGYCQVCTQCQTVFPEKQKIPSNDSINNFWSQINIIVNNTTIINGEESFNCDVDLEKQILNNNTLTILFNQALDGHKITKISEIISNINTNFKYCNLIWYVFNQQIWKVDVESIHMKHCIVNIEEYLNKIYRHYQNNSLYKRLLNNIKSLHTKLHKPAFENEIITGAKMFFMDEGFFKLLNSKKHLVPFNNGVWDLINNEFRKTEKDDYVNLTLKYDYKPNVNTSQIWTFLCQILPEKSIRDWVLKKLSECLNGDIPNTHFLMFIGDGANGKSQLLNLMKTTMGELGEKVEVTLLTRKRNNANETNSEKMKLMNKRFAFLSEPEDGEKINIGLLKELTGSEEIVARGLYQDSMTFIMETKLFLACNELPEIKGEDTALWRRIRVVDFPSRFVDEPKESERLEFKIDRTLPSRMREDVAWRQGFMNILIEYYYKDIPEPEEVKCRTDEYRQENSEFEAWLADHMVLKPGSTVKLNELVETFLGLAKVSSRILSKFKKDIEKWIKHKFPNEDFEYKKRSVNQDRFHCWINFSLE